MRKFKTRRPHSLPFRLLVILAGALLLLAAFAPCANAQGLLRFYDFEATGTGYPVNLGSHFPAQQTGFTLNLESTTGGIPYPVINTLVGPPTQLNLPPGAPPSTVSLGIQRAGVTNLNMEIPFISATGIYDIDSVSFAVGSNGNGFLQVALQMSTDGGLTFANIPGVALQQSQRREYITFTSRTERLSTFLISSCGLVSPWDSPMAPISRLQSITLR